ncbi:MAG: GtrA family protein [Lachnospiraceae bacterium]|nr:GtrA family protein [Lachnospiraceae bacterium]
MDKKAEKRKKLLKQILKFGVVGGLAFLIDFIVYTIVLKLINWEYGYLIAGIMGFTVSLIFNYFASMKFVFERKEDADRKTEFVIFLVLSLIGLLLNTFVLWLCMDVVYEKSNAVKNLVGSLYSFVSSLKAGAISSASELAALIAKVIATGIVMVYNFISRKMTLEKKDVE